MKLQLINDINTLKSTDNATQIELAVVDEQQQFIDLSQFEMILVNIGSGGALYSSETPVVNEDGNTFSFTLSQALPVGKYQIQVHLTTHDGKLHIAPHKGAETLTIEKSFNEIEGETIVVMTIQQLLDDMASTLRVAEESNTKADTAVAKADSAIDTANIATTDAATAVTLANEAKNIANDAVSSADNANAKSDTATNTANDALTVAQQAIETANSADTKADNAINSASAANDTANDANAKADSAVSTADNAIMVAQQVREEFTHLTEGNTDAELIAARTDEEGVTYDTLKSRIDSEATKRSKAVNDALQDAKDYTDSKVGDIDFSTLSTKVETTDAIQTAKNYTDDKISALVDGADENLNTLREIGEALKTSDTAQAALVATISEKVDKVDGKGLSTNDYTNDEKEKLATLQNYTLSDSVTLDSSTTLATSKAVKTVYDLAQQAKLQANDGKTKIATAIVGKGGNVTSGDTFEELANAIALIGENDVKVARGSFYVYSSKTINITGLSFRPELIVFSGDGTLKNIRGYNIAGVSARPVEYFGMEKTRLDYHETSSNEMYGSIVFGDNSITGTVGFESGQRLNYIVYGGTLR